MILKQFVIQGLIGSCMLGLWASPAGAQAPVPEHSGRDAAQVTILYDAFGKNPAMRKDWGFSALIEYGGKKILFDTGNNAEIFAHNVQTKGIDLTKLDFAIVSHRHGDHTSGLNYLLKVNPSVKSMPRRKTSAYSVRRCPAHSTRAMMRCRPRCGISAGTRQSSSASAALGPMRTSHG